MDAEVRKWMYIVTTIAGLLVPVLIAVRATLAAGGGWFEVLIAAVGAVAALGSGTAAFKLSGQIKDGAFVPEQLSSRVQKTVNELAKAQQEIALAHGEVNQLLDKTTALGPLASQAVDTIRPRTY